MFPLNSMWRFVNLSERDIWFHVFTCSVFSSLFQLKRNKRMCFLFCICRRAFASHRIKYEIHTQGGWRSECTDGEKKMNAHEPRAECSLGDLFVKTAKHICAMYCALLSMHLSLCHIHQHSSKCFSRLMCPSIRNNGEHLCAFVASSARWRINRNNKKNLFHDWVNSSANRRDYLIEWLLHSLASNFSRIFPRNLPFGMK